MTALLRLSVSALALLALPGCVLGGDDQRAPARQSPVAVPSASPSEPSDAESSPPAEIDPESGETLALRATATVTVTTSGTSTSTALEHTELAESALEQTPGETKRVLRLNLADPKRAEDVQLSVDGEASVGSHKTREQGLRVAFYYTPLGIDLLSEDGSCTVEFSKVGSSGVAGTVTCPGVVSEKGSADLRAEFSADAL